MDATLTIQDLLKFILFLLGIGVLTYLIIILRNLSKILGQVRIIADENAKEIDTTIKQLPEISENVNAITKEAKDTLINLQPEINGLLHNVNSISTKVEGITNLIDDTTHKVGDTVGIVTDSISETATAFKFNAKNVTEYLNIIKEILEIIKNTVKKL